MSMLYISLGTQDELRDQIIDLAIEQACMVEPWPSSREAFEQRHDSARSRLGLLAQEIARLTGLVLIEWSAVQKKLVQAKPHTEAYADLQSQLAVLMSKWFVRDTPYEKLVHFPRYLKAVQMRIDKLKSDPQRDRQLMADMAPLLTQYQRALNALKGAPDAQLADFRWMLEELRVSLFAQTLRTPMPVSVKRLQKAWSAMHR